MDKGQLGIGVERRMIFIWEGAVATLPDYVGVAKLERVRLAMRRYDAAVQLWVINEHAIKWMWTMMVRSSFRIDICVTTRSPKFAQAVAQRCERRNWPVRYVFAASAPELGRQLPTMPDVERVVYGLEEQRWSYGPRGLLLSRDSGQIV